MDELRSVDCFFKSCSTGPGSGIQTFDSASAVCCRCGNRSATSAKMGASLDTPLRCPLCNELTLQPVTLKCNHSFCRRCIGDLWSVSPNGPFCCPEWRCKTVYRTLPFDSGVIWPITSPSRRAQPPSTAGALQLH